MKSTVIWFLTGLNLLLAAVLVARVMPVSAAHAQVARPSDYLMIPGRTNGLPYTIIYTIDTTNGYLGGMAYDESSKAMKTMPAIDLKRVFEAGMAPANPGGKQGGGYRQ